MSRQTTLGRFGFKETEHFAQKLRDGNESLYPILFQLRQGQLSVITAVNSLLTSKGCFIRLS